jgi:hypothetical protein
MVTQNNFGKKLFLIILNKFDKYSTIEYLVKHEFLSEIVVATLKEKFIDLEFFKRLEFNIIMNDKVRPTYKQLVYNLIYQDDINTKLEILEEFELKYVCKLLSLTVHKTKTIEQLMDIERFIYKSNEDALKTMLCSISYDDAEGLVIFPKKKEQKEKKEKVPKKDSKKLKNYNLTQKLKLLRQSQYSLSNLVK